MNTVVFKHVPVTDLPERWRVELATAGNATVTVRIEAENTAAGGKLTLTIRCSACGAIARTWPTSPAASAGSAPIGSATAHRARVDRRC